MSISSDRGDSSVQGWLACDRPSRWVGLLSLAVVVRALALWQFGGQLSNDPDAYREIADSLVAGRGFGFAPGQVNGSPTAYRPPLYPCLLALIERGTGNDDDMFRRSIGLMQLLLGTGTVVLVVLIARRLWLGHASLLVGLVVALDPVLVYNTTLVMTETTATFLAALLFWLGFRSHGVMVWLATGVVFGLCCLCRPTFWAFGVFVVPGLLIGAWSQWKSANPVNSFSTWSYAAAALFGTTLTIAPWVGRNVGAMGKPILTTTHGGYTLLLGHNPIYTDRVVNQAWGTVWQIDSDQRWFEWLDAEMRGENPPIDLHQSPSPAVELARDRWMSCRAWHYMRDEPWTAIRSSLTLLGRFWNVVPMATSNRYLPAPLRWMIGAFYAAMFLAGIAGLIRLRRNEWPRWWPCLALILSFTAVHTLYWADLRMRAPLVPMIALLAVRGLIGIRAESSLAVRR